MRPADPRSSACARRGGRVASRPGGASMSGAGESTGWLVSGFEAQVFLWAWIVLALLYGLYRSFVQPDPDSLRASGPGD